MHPQQYLIIVLGFAAALVGGIAAVNLHIDPYGLAPSAKAGVHPGGINDGRPGAFWRKAFIVRDVKPRTVLLGTSRTGGLDALYPKFAPQDAPVLNLSLGASSMEQMRLLLVHASVTSPVHLAIIGLDLESFLDGGRGDFDPAALKGNPESEPEDLVRWRIAVSREAFSASVTSWIAPAADRLGSDQLRDPVTARSGRIPDAMLKDFQGQRGIFWVSEFNNFYPRLPELFPLWPPGTGWSTEKRRSAAMTAFRNLLDYARHRGIELRIFISPVHARYLVWYQRVGWWSMFEAWKRELVDAIDAESKAAAGRRAFVLWDFSGFHTLATEPVPSLGDLMTQMRWYRDTSHYSLDLGNLILDRVLGAPEAEGSPLPDARISAATIERHLYEIRSGAVDYQRSQPAEVAEVATVTDILFYLRRVARK